jgi:hypothetical protein
MRATGPRKAPRTTRPQKKLSGTIRIRPETFKDVRAIARKNRMKVVDLIDAFSNGWSLLTPEQRTQAIENGTEELAAAGT